VATEPIAGLAATAGRQGSSQLVRQAARLLAASGPGYDGEPDNGETDDAKSDDGETAAGETEDRRETADR
jgi:hypothetical protein